MILLTGLTSYGTLVYLLARVGHLKRLREAAASAADDPLCENASTDGATLLALIPSYREEPQTVRRALISAALQPFSPRRVVLLLDDPPEDPPTASLRAVRRLPITIQEMLQPMRDSLDAAWRQFKQRTAIGFTPAAEAKHLADLCHRTADWFETQADQQPVAEVADDFFVTLTFHIPAFRWRRAADRWTSLAADPTTGVSFDALCQAYAHLLAGFRVEITSFERKQFVNLSHTANKAMNINSYLGLIGGSYRREWTDAGVQLSRCNAADAELIIPDADFALILDADTIVSSDYTPKLVRRFHERGGEELAVAQSPCSTFPGDRTILHRIAGAQTDIGYLMHQGLTHYNATYWIGAASLVRVAALRDIAEKAVERGFEIVKFICDRTLIEDTESTIDLVRKGWRLFNEPERLAFSMTPPDFGALLIQRRRWANGGLLIVPKLLVYLHQRPNRAHQLVEGLMRLHYLLAIGPVSMALLVALGVALDKQARPLCLAAIGLIYYVMYARDLHLIGYHLRDIFRVIALNLLLIPVSLMGMALSLVQAVTGRKAQFSRTPKIHERTRVPAQYIMAEFALLALWCALTVLNLRTSGLGRAVTMLVHALFLIYAMGAFIGYRNAGADIAAGLMGRRNVKMARRRTQVDNEAV